ncbi:hypothetical protein SAMN04244547_03892 [Azotobacter vinelandii]|nr:hypothetical protein SAMN04244547_03892 [Azotobacter vinelandii]
MDTLPTEQKMKALGAMQKVPDTLRNAVMTQWLHRCSEGTVGKPLAYLMSLVGLAVRGEFNADWRPESTTALPSSGTPTVAGKAPSRPTEPALPGATATSRTPETMRTAREQLTAMQHLLRPRQGPTNSPTSGTKAD